MRSPSSTRLAVSPLLRHQANAISSPPRRLTQRRHRPGRLPRPRRCHDISDIVHLAGSIPGKDPVRFFRTDTAGLLNALDAARTWGVRRFAVASSLGVYIGRAETRWHEELALPAVEVPHLIIAFTPEGKSASW